MSAFPDMWVDKSVATDWGNGLLRNSPIGDAIIGSPFAAAGDSVYHTPDNPHSGVDLPTWQGCPIREVKDGVVDAYGWDNGAGWWFRTKYADGSSSFYCHMMQSPTGFNAGQPIAKGTLVGFVGSTGNSTGPHLHWTLNAPGYRPVDPLAYVGPDGKDFTQAEVITTSSQPENAPAVWVDMQTVNVGDIRIVIENELAPALVKLHRMAGGDGDIIRGRSL